ncbi:MAG TPA: hypothetical protein PLK12_08845 [Prolixibacteraceae bacterium]|nr:hypothetical protein [Prolixibacteraceae bacterium]
MKKNYGRLLTLAIILSALLTMNPSCAPEPSPGIFTQQNDVGNPKLKGSSAYDPASDSYTLRGAGENMWFGRDEFHFLSLPVEGDFLLQARVRFIGEGVNAHRKIGIMVRDSLTAESAHVNGVVHGDGLTSLQFRRNAGGDTEEIKAPSLTPNVIQLERKGNRFILATAVEGESFIRVEIDSLILKKKAHVGLFICSHEADVREEAVFDNVRLIIPAPANFTPYRDYIGSHIEILTLETGKREILFSGLRSLQAPNWSPDGKRLVYNEDGKLYEYELETGAVKVINTGFAVNNNNDHVLSFDGQWQGISDHTEDPGGVVAGLCCTVRRGNAPAHHGRSPLLPARVLARWRILGVHGRAKPGRTPRHLPYFASFGRRSAPDRCPRPRRRFGICARRAVYLFQFEPDRHHADLADEARWKRTGATNLRRVQRLVPACVARRPDAGLPLLFTRRALRRSSFLQTGVHPHHAGKRGSYPGCGLPLRGPGLHERIQLVARREENCVCEQYGYGRMKTKTSFTECSTLSFG